MRSCAFSEGCSLVVASTPSQPLRGTPSCALQDRQCYGTVPCWTGAQMHTHLNTSIVSVHGQISCYVVMLTLLQFVSSWSTERAGGSEG